MHAALKRGLGLDDDAARVVQAETGGGFGGKEEFPSVIALHAALLARKAQKPVRMIYDRHEDIAATTKRHPAIVRHRTGVTRDGRLVAQDIEVVMDGGAYCTLTPVVLSRGALHAGGPYRCPNVRIRARATRTNTPPNGAFRGFGAPQTEFAAETHLNRIAERLGHLARSRSGGATSTGPGDTTPTGQVLRDSVAGEEVLERAAEASRVRRGCGPGPRTRGGARAGSGSIPGSAAPHGNASGRRRGIGLALAWHGAGFTGSGEVHLASVASLELTAEGRVRILTASTEMGQGTKTIFPQLVAEALGVAGRRRRDRAAGHRVRARLRPDRRVADRDGRRRAAHQGGPPPARAGRDRDRRLVRATRRRATPATTARPAIDQQFEPYPGGTPFDDATYTGDAYPAFGWAACVAHVDVDLDTGEVHVRDVVAADDIGRVIHPVLAEGQVEGGTLQAVGYATIEEIKLRDGRYLNDRLATYIIPTALDAPRISTILVEAPFGGAPHGAKGVGELPMDVGAPAVVAAIADATGVWITRPAGQPGADPRGARRLGRTSPACGPRESAPALERDRVTTYRFDGQRHAGRGRRARHAPAARRAARGPRPDRHEGGLRRRGVRRVHGPASTARRSTRASSRSARSTGADVRTVEGLAPASTADALAAPATAPSLDALQARVPRDRRRPVRHLHARDAHGGPRLPRRRAAARTRTRSARRSPATLPLHGLHQDRRRRSRSRARRRRLGQPRCRSSRRVDRAARAALDRARLRPSSPARAPPDAPARPIAGGTDLMVALTGELGEPPDERRRPVGDR